MYFDKNIFKTLALKRYYITSLNSSRFFTTSITNKLLHKNLNSIIVNSITYYVIDNFEAVV